MISYSIDTSIETKNCENIMVYSKFKICHNQIGGKKELQEQALKLKLVKEKSELYNLSELDLLYLPEMYNYTKIQRPTWQHDLTNECRRFEDSLFASWMYITLAIFADQMMVKAYQNDNFLTFMLLGLVNLWMMSALSIKCDRGRSENLGGRAVIEVYLMEHLQESDWSFWEFASTISSPVGVSFYFGQNYNVF